MQGTRQRYQFGSLRIRPRKKGPNVWELRTYAQRENGKRKPQSTIIGTVVEFPTETSARKKCEAILLEINQEAPQYAISDPSFGALLDRFITEERLTVIAKAKQADGPNAEALEYSTASSYLSYINRHIRPMWGSKLFHKMRPMLIQRWLRALDLAPTTKGHIRSLMHRIYEKAMLWELLEVQRNPIDLVEIRGVSKRRKKPVVLTTEHFLALIDQLEDEPYRTMVIVAMCLGLRVSEVLALQWSDIDFGELFMSVTRKVVNGRVSRVKTEYSGDDLPLDPAFAERLLRWYRRCPETEEGWVFPNPNTLKPFWASEIQKNYLVPAGKKVGIERLGWHALRHTYRSLLDATGAPIGVQQKLMRHAQVGTTMNQYGNALMHSKREANSKVVRQVLPEEVE